MVVGFLDFDGSDSVPIVCKRFLEQTTVSDVSPPSIVVSDPLRWSY